MKHIYKQRNIKSDFVLIVRKDRIL